MAVKTVGNTEGGANDYDVAVGAGAVDADTQRLTLASDDPAVVLLGTIDADTSTLAGAVSGTEMQVDVLTLPALPAGTNNIGDVDVASLPARSHGWKAYTAAIASALTTELDALANGSATAASAAIDNTSTLDTHIDVTVTLATQGSARSAGATVAVYVIYALDGTNYDRAVAATAELLVVLPYDAATTGTTSARDSSSARPAATWLGVGGAGVVLSAASFYLAGRSRAAWEQAEGDEAIISRYRTNHLFWGLGAGFGVVAVVGGAGAAVSVAW